MGLFIYLFGVVFGGIFSMGLYILLSDYKQFQNFKRELDVSAGQIIATMTVFWPLTILSVAVLSIGFSVHSVYAIFKNLIKMYKRGK